MKCYLRIAEQVLVMCFSLPTSFTFPPEQDVEAKKQSWIYELWQIAWRCQTFEFVIILINLTPYAAAERKAGQKGGCARERTIYVFGEVRHDLW